MNNKFIHWIPGIIISIVAIYLLYRIVDVNELINALLSFSYLTIAMIILLVFLSLFARGCAWRSLLADTPGIIDSFFGICVGYMLNNIIPRSGEIGRSILMSSKTGLGTIHVLSSVIIERAVDLAIASCLFLSTITLVVQMDWLKPVALLLLTIVAMGLFTLFVMANQRQKVIEWLTSRSEKNRLVKKYIQPILSSLLDGLMVLTKPVQLIKSIIWILISWTCWTILFYLALITFVPQAPFWWAIFTQGVLAMGIALPSAPASLGVYEGTTVVALSVLGVSSTYTLGLALVLHIIQILITTILGIWGMQRRGWTLQELIKKIQIRKPAQ